MLGSDPARDTSVQENEVLRIDHDFFFLNFAVNRRTYMDCVNNLASDTSSVISRKRAVKCCDESNPIGTQDVAMTG